MNETARDSIAALAINVLKSIRSVTKVAKKSKMKADVKKDNTLVVSCTTSNGKRLPCARIAGSNTRYTGKETTIVSKSCPITQMKVFRFTDVNRKHPKNYLVFAGTIGEAKRMARNIIQRRGLRYSGLAKRAIGWLMMKTNTQKVNDVYNPLVDSKANENTSKKEVVVKSNDGGKYGLILQDDLNYSLKAIKGGRCTVDIQMKKAMNKIVSIINRKIKGGDFISGKELETPFPEVRGRKK